jgi:ABC-2 type transport system ATP-binding protein
MGRYKIEVESLTKKFGEFTAVDGVSFKVEEGQIFGFLGPNGAGKSTTIKMLCGILAPTSGEGHVAGISIKEKPESIKSMIGYMSQKFSLYDDLTVSENLDLFAGLYDVPSRAGEERKKKMIEMAGLVGRENSLTFELSKGFKQRLALGCAIIHSPHILFLDEPTAGVDPVSRRHFWGLIYDMARAGTSVLVTTHYMDEAEHCDTLAMIYDGRIIAGGSPAEIKSGVGVDLPAAPTLEDVFVELIKNEEKKKRER